MRFIKLHHHIVQFNSASHIFRRNFVLITKTPDNLAIVQLNRPPVNALSLDFMTKIKHTFIELNEDKSIEGIILGSFSEKIFSSGLDLHEIQQVENVNKIAAEFTNMSSTLYGSISKPFAVAISGHAPAGGTVLAMCADYRVVTPNAYLGLNEARLGIVVPSWLSLMYQNLIGQRQSELALMLGTLFNSKYALKLGLVDEIVEDKDEAIRKCTEIVRRLIKEPEKEARELSKILSRKNVLLEMKLDRNGETMASFFKRDKVQSSIKSYLKTLKK
ncbi:enoyl-CoA delta isomerase 1, mitochondrial [Lepeophtheirus salmonis]|uniref:enoyl-CoA delta isomerase 1, mitochondrial n=1 Tax=Lepeophtheirus salmonis TaxID=72036 RepID=UPI001AE3F175|nr:enoyl-CoA delta isomerase 1, mitochondrial-like [Lepeophtheirus salmonis]